MHNAPCASRNATGAARNLERLLRIGEGGGSGNPNSLKMLVFHATAARCFRRAENHGKTTASDRKPGIQGSRPGKNDPGNGFPTERGAVAAIKGAKARIDLAQQVDVHPHNPSLWRDRLLEDATGVFGPPCAPSETPGGSIPPPDEPPSSRTGIPPTRPATLLGQGQKPRSLAENRLLTRNRSAAPRTGSR